MASNVKITVYDLLGREVEVLIDNYMQAGVYALNFNAGGLSSGLYYYSLHAGNDIEVKKAMLIK